MRWWKRWMNFCRWSEMTGSLGRAAWLWLTAKTPDANVELPGFSLVRVNRDTAACVQSKGGGLVLYVNQRWCNSGHLTVKSVVCYKDCKLLASDPVTYQGGSRTFWLFVFTSHLKLTWRQRSRLCRLRLQSSKHDILMPLWSFQGTLTTSPWSLHCNQSTTTNNTLLARTKP